MMNELDQKVLALLRKLPEDKQVEVLDFTYFLWHRSRATGSDKNLGTDMVSDARGRVAQRADQIKREGGSQLERLISELGGRRKPTAGWDSTEFIRQDRDRR